MPGLTSEFALRAYLLGSWSVDRTLWDRRSGARGTFAGVVRFTALNGGNDGGGGGLSFHEEGTMRWPTSAGEAFTGPASRDYLLRATDSPGTMDMTFPDGRPFHRMSFSEAASQDKHWCDPDTYRVTYALLGPDEFSYVWDVQGPNKDQLLESVLRRLDPTTSYPAANGPKG